MEVRTALPSRIDALTGVRYFAALFVAVHHLWPKTIPLTGAARGIMATVGDGSVSLFFLLSGIVLVHSNVGSDGLLRKTRRQFWVARVARIYPMYLFALLLISLPAGAMLWQEHRNIVAVTARCIAYFGTSALMVQAWTPFAVAWNGPGWSLSVEALFYLCFPALVAIGRSGTRLLLLLAILCWLLSGAFATLSVSSGPMLFEYFPPLRLPEFVLGMILGFLLRRGAAEPLRHAAVPAIIGLFLVGAIVPELAYRVVSMPLLAALLLALSVSRGPVARFLGSPPLVSLGSASYALYVLHIPLFRWFQLAIGNGFTTRASSLAMLAVFLILLTLASLLAHHRLEVPLAGWVNRWLGGKGNAAREADERSGAASARLAG